MIKIVVIGVTLLSCYCVCVTLLLKYSISFHLIPSCAYSSWGEQKSLTIILRTSSWLFHLLCFHCQLYEDLLQLLVDKIDAELLEAVLLEDLKAVDVEDADAEHLLL